MVGPVNEQLLCLPENRGQCSVWTIFSGYISEFFTMSLYCSLAITKTQWGNFAFLGCHGKTHSEAGINAWCMGDVW